MCVAGAAPSHLYIVGGEGAFATPLKTVQRVAVTGEQMSVLLDIPLQDTAIRAAVALDPVTGVLYVTGGWDTESKVWAVDVRSGEWRSLPPLNQGRWAHCCFILDGHLCVVAGLGDGHRYLSDMEVLDLHSPNAVWQPGPPPLEAVSGAAACTTTRGVLLTGGLTSPGKSSRMVSLLDAISGEWTPRQDMLKGRCYHSMASDGHRAWCVGGIGESSCEEYNLTTDTWTSITPLPGWRTWTGEYNFVLLHISSRYNTLCTLSHSNRIYLHNMEIYGHNMEIYGHNMEIY